MNVTPAYVLGHATLKSKISSFRRRHRTRYPKADPRMRHRPGCKYSTSVADRETCPCCLPKRSGIPAASLHSIARSRAIE